MNHEIFLQAAIEEAELSESTGGIPIGSVLVHDGKIVGRGHNQRVQKNDPILHAEMDAIQNAGRRSAVFYSKCTLYSTLSPCPMCSGTVLLFKIPRVIVGENISFQGPEEYIRSQGVELLILQNEKCIGMMQRFMQEKPELWNEDIAV
ncbi:MAG: nucleoside deaminase [Chthoniobacterales bacterium]